MRELRIRIDERNCRRIKEDGLLVIADRIAKIVTGDSVGAKHPGDDPYLFSLGVCCGDNGWWLRYTPPTGIGEGELILRVGGKCTRGISDDRMQSLTSVIIWLCGLDISV